MVQGFENPKLKGLKKQEGKKQLFETVILRTRVVFLLFRYARTQNARERKRKREERTPNDVLLFRVLVYDFIVFLFLYIIRYYIHTNKRVIISETTQIIRRCSRSSNENTREVTLTLCTQKRVSSLYRSFLNAFVVVLVSRGFANERARRKRECTI